MLPLSSIATPLFATLADYAAAMLAVIITYVDIRFISLLPLLLMPPCFSFAAFAAMPPCHATPLLPLFSLSLRHAADYTAPLTLLYYC